MSYGQAERESVWQEGLRRKEHFLGWRFIVGIGGSAVSLFTLWLLTGTMLRRTADEKKVQGFASREIGDIYTQGTRLHVRTAKCNVMAAAIHIGLSNVDTGIVFNNPGVDKESDRISYTTRFLSVSCGRLRLGGLGDVSWLDSEALIPFRYLVAEELGK
ncbi:uncharacterized protein EV420DRAFT_1474686 [Desarmillaria tabescens]|uniref:Uncharacterized protein n=1 Tax=Armillaria tabescens TaxID=1929756 RepID=A0AA39NHQ4_ARMTA|nr:uncharacterized protein EV420DRAFT_1474686 [Desarmillaria tabescens]KAK0465858.1 hypothetical protein EV420DRAFT_1474686 [Desarmillaria tabescens]